AHPDQTQNPLLSFLQDQLPWTVFPSSSSLPLFPCYKSHFPQSLNPNFSTLLLKNGIGLGGQVVRRSPRRIQPVRAVVKRRKERPFDEVVQRDKKLKLVLKIRKILVAQPDRTMPLREMGRFRKELGLNRKRRFIALLKKFPAVFDIVEEGAYLLQFKLTPEAERLYFEELKVLNELEDILVVKLRKLLMMSLEKRILLEKIAHLRNDLGLPLEFRDTICNRYPHYFKVVQTERGRALELTHWDPELAVSAWELSAEEKRAKEAEEKDLIIDRPLKFNRPKLPRGLQLTRGELKKISRFNDIPYISPYDDFTQLRPGTREKEKHACGVIHEMLSLTVEKRTLVDHLTHFREEFRFSQQVRGMLIRHPDLFYVSLKGDRDSVFLREAYSNSHLIDKDRMLLIKEKLRSLVNVPRFGRRVPTRVEQNGDDAQGDVSGDEDWSDIDSFMDNGDDDDDNDDDDDDWGGVDDETPPSSEDDEASKVKIPVRETSKLANEQNGRPLSPVFPDGRPRERW
ncbi:Protein WHAT'S THIS FACTOR 1 homolog, chloroplastic, partial [Linum grandiflorum]